MKKVLFNHHIDLRYILTPIASTGWTLKEGFKRRFIYIFGIRIISWSV